MYRLTYIPRGMVILYWGDQGDNQSHCSVRVSSRLLRSSNLSNVEDLRGSRHRRRFLPKRTEGYLFRDARQEHERFWQTTDRRCANGNESCRMLPVNG